LTCLIEPRGSIEHTNKIIDHPKREMLLENIKEYNHCSKSVSSRTLND